jgi:hypothetical protein
MIASSARLARRAAPPALVFVLLASAGCSSTPAAAIAQPPEYAPKGEAKCGVTKSQAEPLIVEWPSAARGKLETQARRGLVAVRYIGCEMQVLSGCRAPGEYEYAPMTRKRDRLSIRNEDDLYASIPVYAASFEGKLRTAGELNVRMTLVGRYEADRQGVRKDELSGDECSGATHVITAITAGAFQFFAGADAEAGAGAGIAGAGVGAQSAAQREILREDGDDVSCEKASRNDKEPPEGCAAMLRVEVVPIGEASAPPAAQAALELSRAKGVPSPMPEVPEGVTEGSLSVTGKLSQEEVQRVLRGTLNGAKHCFELARKKDPGLSGRVNVNLTIGKVGDVADVTSAGSSIADAGVQSCVLKLVKEQTFPAPGEGTVRVVYPITFTAPARPPPQQSAPSGLDGKRD